MPEHNNIPLLIGRIIRTERVRQGLSQEKLAEVAGLHRTYIGMVERGEKNITLLNYVRISAALNVPMHALMASLPIPSLSSNGSLLETPGMAESS
ncbi:MAG: helix-turn-helix transcriptional regulator [Chlorobiaceae bacterium]|nr:helix-turn-helix transcriptional regulator [Chlorobiaceae bacterium]